MIKKHLPKNFWILMIVCSLWMTSCDSDDVSTPKAEPTPSTLVSFEKDFERAAGDLRGFINLSELNVDVTDMQIPVIRYDMEYKTVYKGDTIVASAVVLVPNTDKAVGTISFQHGTIAADEEAPTNLISGNYQIIFTSALASTGFLVVLPDYIGFGASSEQMHPYYVEEPTATAVMNAIYAARELSTAEGFSVSEDLYLAGYSQGGYATMATHKYYEENDIPFYDLKASFPSSGGYDIKSFQEYYFGLETYDQPFFMAYVAQAYKETYDWSESLSLYFNEPYASAIPSLFDGNSSGGEINDQLNDTVSVFVNQNFLSNPEGSDYDHINAAFEENSLIDWTPQIRMFMYHGDADITVPYQNSVSVYNQLIANGASESVVTFTTLEGGTHNTGVGPYIENLAWEMAKFKD